MVLNFKLPDDVFEVYVKRFGVQGTYARFRKIIEEMKDVDPQDRYILVAGDNRRAIEAVFQTTIDDSAKLAKMVKQLNTVKVEGVELSFTTDELARIDAQAGFHGRTREVFIAEMAREIKDMMLEKC